MARLLSEDRRAGRLKSWACTARSFRYTAFTILIITGDAMIRLPLRLALLAALAGLLVGCDDLGPWGGPAYTVDWNKIGTGEQAILPRNDASYWNGEAMDYRSRR
jgi:hypothetical protein